MKISIKHNNTKLKTDDVELAGMFLAKIAKETSEECCDEDLSPEEKVRIVSMLHDLKNHLKEKFEEKQAEQKPVKEETVKPKAIIKEKVSKPVVKKKKVRITFVPWTVEEDLIVFNCLRNKMTPKQISLFKELSRHTKPAIRTRASVIENKQYKNMNKINSKAIKEAYTLTKK